MQPDSGRVSSAKSADVRGKPTKAELRSERSAARLEGIERNASSIPPAAMHDVFDVSVPPHGRTLGSVPPPLPPRGERRKSARPSSHKPAPHPPRPTKPPTPEPALATQGAAPVTAPEDGVELAPNEYEFASDSFGIPTLAPPRTDAPLALHAELPPERVDERRPARIPYRTIALTSASLMVAVIVAGLARPKEEQRALAKAAAPQKPIAVAFAEAPDKSPIVPVTAVGKTPAASGSESEPVAALQVPSASASGAATKVAEGSIAAANPSAASAVEPARSLHRVSHPDAGVVAGFDAAAASSAISAAFARASSCLKDGDSNKPATILLTYAPSGRVTTAVLQGPYSGTAVGGCIASTLRTARVPPFAGDYVTVKRTTVLR